MEVLPGDKVFIAIVADVWFDANSLAATSPMSRRGWTTPSGANWNKYAEARDKYFKNEAPHPRQAGYVPS